MKRYIALFLTLCLLLSGCGKDTPVKHGEDLMEKIQPAGAAQVQDLETDSAAIADFGLRLFRQSMDAEKNTLISPLSVLYALSMTANGASGNTLSQMEAVLGLPVDSLNGWLSGYLAQLSQPDREKLRLANAIWFKDDPGLTVEPSFLQTNADFYGAGIYKAPFDKTTLADINRYVAQNTDGMVTDILDKIPEDAVMYLVNALAFTAKWAEVYTNLQIWEDTFTTQDGAKRTVEMMRSEEYAYLEDENATGFLKYYEDRRYAFAALLPREGMTVAEYVQSLDGEALHQMLTHPQEVTVNTAIPKFETAYDTQMKEALIAMGMPDAFDWTAADFSRLGTSEDGYICIGRVLHKTFLSVAEEGTRAGAATVVEMVAESAMEMEEPKVVTLDRPFLYMILDCQTGTPLFMGTLLDTEA